MPLGHQAMTPSLQGSGKLTILNPGNLSKQTRFRASITRLDKVIQNLSFTLTPQENSFSFLRSMYFHTLKVNPINYPQHFLDNPRFIGRTSTQGQPTTIQPTMLLKGAGMTAGQKHIFRRLRGKAGRRGGTETMR